MGCTSEFANMVHRTEGYKSGGGDLRLCPSLRDLDTDSVFFLAQGRFSVDVKRRRYGMTCAQKSLRNLTENLRKIKKSL